MKKLLILLAVHFFYFESKFIYSQSIISIDSSLIKYNFIYYKTDFKENLKNLNELLKKSKLIDYKKGEADIYRRLGILYKNNGHFQKAIEYYLRSLSISESINYPTGSASTYNNLASIYSEIGDNIKTIFYLKKALDLHESNGFDLGIADVCSAISNIYIELDSIDKAYDYSLKGLAAQRKLKDTASLAYTLYNIGFIFEAKEKHDSSLKYYNQCVDFYMTTRDISSFIQSNNGIGRIYLYVKNIDSSLKYHHRSADSAIKYQNRPLLAETYGYLANAYQVRGDTLQAYKYLKLESVLKDALLDDVKVNAIVNAERKYDSEIKTRTITEQANQIKIGRLWLVIVIIVSISIVVIAFLLIRGYRNRQRMAQKEIDEQRRRVDDLMQKQEVENVNAMLKGQDEERKRIAQELHDRIGSILSTVKLHFTNVETGIALLKEQQNKSYAEAVGLLDEAVDEVRRISHDLYEGSLAKFGFKTALLQLIAAIEKANVVHVTFIDNGVERDAYKEFEQDLYRITQELLSNSLKYAQAKEITIQLNHKQGVVEYMYEDDGIGFNIQKIADSAGIGYKNIAARVAKMGGTWHLDTQPNHGMTLIIELPIDYGKD